MTENETEKSRMSITGRNALHALGIALVGVILLTLLYGIVIAGIRFFDTGQVDPSRLLYDAFGLFQFIGICAGPVIFLLGFALLQRIRLPW